MPDASPRWLTPPQVAERLGIDAARVRGWIMRGELAACDLSERQGGRPRWRVSPDALDSFLRRRAAVAPAQPVRRRRATAAYTPKYY